MIIITIRDYGSMQDEEYKRMLALEGIVAALSESNRLISYQVTKLDEQVNMMNRTLSEVRDAILRMESFPSQVNELKNEVSDLDLRLRALENAKVSDDAQKNLIGWLVKNWHSLLALGIAAALVLKSSV